MYKILIADDEPLARIGLSTMISSAFDQVELTGSVRDGQEAVEAIQQNMPDIIITDIKMPVMDGLELLQYVHEHFEPPVPLFIFLTSYEDFQYVRTALKLEAYDYLVKMEFNKEILTQVLERAFLKVDEERKKYARAAESDEQANTNLFINRFLYHLLSGGYYSEEQVLDIARDYHQDLSADRYQTIALQLRYTDKIAGQKTQYSMYMNILNAVKTVISRYTRCIMVAYNHQTIGIILLLDKDADMKSICNHALSDAGNLCRQYFNIKLCSGVGMESGSVVDVASSFSCARRALNDAAGADDIIFYSVNHHLHQNADPNFSISELNHNLITALEHNDILLFDKTIETLSAQLDQSSPETVINMISCLIHWIINCLSNGEQLLADAFAKEPRGYQVLYTYHSRTEISAYLSKISQLVRGVMQKQLNDPKYKITMDAKAYIQEHIYNKLSLSEVASAIGISQNYLSSLFKLYNDLGFSDYVASLKIKMAQKLLATEHLKIYQVSEKLGFDNPQYFSKVYKKYTGYSPSEFTAVSQEQQSGSREKEH
ncbi:response regulator transcription factor [Cuneatibacter caecimuris]|uniref:Stage 0 sporulation protein A homolog n=1 Tax=Cuneatibacter caecimuris TaxID=1796618 RepID=A0A4Q7PP51_9FIRM|nr:response regulator [Cuneatibacter caecimuris]RZT02769.1 YesN/AraC family two-component response regulator [Cuneatibacter caecimuris]